MSALAQPNQVNTSKDSVTSISVNARIDYILRFSKHAILVVDESAEDCSSVGYQFLDQLSSQHNAAFVSSSAKLNNIQIRCRIIEQLFSGCVFDPEQSLAVSIVNLLNANPQKLAIVIDNVQFSSLQIMHELTQLALIAKKAQLEIEVLMLGNYTAGKMLAEHKELFNKKISILSKQSGQLLSLNAKEFKTPQSWLTLTLSKKWIITLMSFSLIAIMTVVWLQQQDTFSYSKLAGKNSVVNEGAEQTVLPTIFEQIDTKLSAVNVSQKADGKASATYIYNILSGNIIVKPEVPTQPANVSDIVSAIAAFKAAPLTNKKSAVATLQDKGEPPRLPTAEVDENRINKASSLIESENTLPLVESTITNTNANLIVNPITKENAITDNKSVVELVNPKLGNNYYKSFNQGFVIQISGFTQESILQEFLADFTNIEFKQYKRLLNDEIMTVLTSKYYATHAEAEQALYALPDTILARAPWIKSISAINNEINAFERSQ